MKTKLIKIWALPALSILTAIVACNKSANNSLGAETNADTSVVTNKVLFIAIDGAVGDEVRKVQAPTFVSMADNSIYSWDALSDYDNNASGNYLTWANLLTGTTPAKHNVTGNSFAGNNFAAYPSIFTRIKNSYPSIKTASYTATQALADNLTADATVKQSFENNDVAVKDAAKKELAATEGADLVFVQLHNLDIVGAANGYSATNSAYRTAVLTADAQVKEMLDVIAARPTYAKENWLIMVVSNKGSNTPFVPGAGEIWSAFRDSRHNTMFIAYNFTVVPNFRIQATNKPIIIPYIGTTPVYNGTPSQNKRAALQGNTTLGDIGATGSFTMQCKFKVPVNANGYYYPAFFGKRASLSGGVPGWVFFLENQGWYVNFGQTSMSNSQLRHNTNGTATVVSNNQWHTLTVTVTQESATSRLVRIYTDGVPGTDANGNVQTLNISSLGNLVSPTALRAGMIPPQDYSSTYNLNDFQVTDIRFYNTALSAAYIGSNYCQTDVGTTDAYYNNLLGFWPSTDVGENRILKEATGKAPDMLVETLNPGVFNDATTRVCPPVLPQVYRSVPNSVDVSMQVYNWLRIVTPTTWNLDGKTWVPQYVNVR